MDSPNSNRVGIFEIYRRYCDIRSGKAYKDISNGQDDETQWSKFSRDALAQLLKFVESSLYSRISIFDELLMLKLNLGCMVDFSEFAHFYDFVFFMCRQNGQKNITVSMAVTAWKLVLVGRFRLLNQWCDFVQENQRHNISEDTWQQLLAFSQCVHENLEGYDPKGAWPVLIDDFVEHMYRVSGPKDLNFFCNCGDSESQSCVSEDPLLGLKITPGLKRKFPSIQKDEMEALDTTDLILNLKRSRQIDVRLFNWDDIAPGNSTNDCMEVIKLSNPLGSTKSPCAVEGCLSKGFAGLFSTCSYLQYDQEREVSYTLT